MRTLERAGAATIVVVASLLLAAPAATADTNDFSFDSFDADYYLSKGDDGFSDLKTVETLTAVFPDYDQNHGIERAIPSSYDGHSTHVAITSVTDETGTLLNWTTYEQGEFLVVRIGDSYQYAYGTHTYVHTYTQREVTKYFGDTKVDEFYWDTNGTGWDQPFGSVTARVHVDSSLTSAVVGEPRCYWGVEGSTATCPAAWTADGAGGVMTASQADLGPGENLTVAIGFEKGTFRQSSPSASYVIERVLPSIPPVAMILLLITSIIGRFTRWRPPAARGTKIVQYSPPDPEDLYLSANIIGRDNLGLPAEIINLAIHRYIKIIEVDPAGKPGQRFTLGLSDTTGASARDQELIDTLFGKKAEPGAVFELDDQSVKLARKLRVLAGAADVRATQLGFRAKILSPLKSFVRGWSWVAVLGAFAVAFFASDTLFDWLPIWAWWMIAIGSAIAMIIIHRLATLRPQFTRPGLDYRDHLIGMREYLTLAEEDRLRMLQSPDGADRVVSGDTTVVKVYEKLLPYAVLWGVEEQWSRELELQYAATGATTDWYSGSTGLSRGFVASVVTSAQSTAAVPEPSTSSYSGSGGSSSFGGSSGGGSSGGGGGGGGGGGW